ARPHGGGDPAEHIELLQRRQREADEEPAEPGGRRIAHPARRHPGTHDLRALDLAVEHSATREQTDSRVQPTRAKVGNERQHGTLGAAAVERRQEEQHARRRVRVGGPHVSAVVAPSPSYIDSNLWAEASQVKASRTRRRPRAASSAACSGCRESCSMASRSASTSPAGHSAPLCPCSTSSLVPPTRVAMSGVPTAIADRTARLKLSSCEGRMAIED